MVFQQLFTFLKVRCSVHLQAVQGGLFTKTHPILFFPFYETFLIFFNRFPIFKFPKLFFAKICYFVLALCSLLLYFVAYRFRFWWFQKFSANFWSHSDHFKFWKFPTWRWLKVKKSISQLPIGLFQRTFLKPLKGSRWDWKKQNPEAVFLVVCNLSLNELWVT